MNGNAELTNALRKRYASLSTAKGRREEGLFMAQGTKCVRDTLPHFALEALLATAEWFAENPDIRPAEAITVKRSDIERISTLTTPIPVIAIYRLPAATLTEPKADKLYLALDCVQDPGNLGTIIRLADWFGITTIYASADTADVWNPKVVQATMGAIARVKVEYCDLVRLLESRENVYGTFLDGENIYHKKLTPGGIIVMGNEGKGISTAIESKVSDRLFIPPYPGNRETSESLNVATATAITLSEFRRRNG